MPLPPQRGCNSAAGYSKRNAVSHDAHSNAFYYCRSGCVLLSDSLPDVTQLRHDGTGMSTFRGAWLLLLIAATAAAQTTSGWQLVWSDEFNGAAGTAPDKAKWNFDLGGGGWGNGEVEVYTSSTNNVFQDGNGNLVIRAIKDAQGNYTSARLQTGAPAASTTHGPIGAGNTAASRRASSFPSARASGRLSGCWARISLRLPGRLAAKSTSWRTSGPTTTTPPSTTEPRMARAIPAAMAWEPRTRCRSAKRYTTTTTCTPSSGRRIPSSGTSTAPPITRVTPASLPAGAKWVFNAPFFLLLNLAIGGPTSFLGTPDAGVTFPQDMLVDYVRVYQSATISTATPVITPGRIVNAASYLGAISPGSLATVYGNNLADAVHLTQQAGWQFPHERGGRHGERQRRERSARLRFSDADQLSGAVGNRARPGGARQGDLERCGQQRRAGDDCFDGCTRVLSE